MAVFYFAPRVLDDVTQALAVAGLQARDKTGRLVKVPNHHGNGFDLARAALSQFIGGEVQAQQ